MKTPSFLAMCLMAATTADTSANAPTALKVSENKRSLVTGDGRPFFWLGDTAWHARRGGHLLLRLFPLR